MFKFAKDMAGESMDLTATIRWTIVSALLATAIWFYFPADTAQQTVPKEVITASAPQ